MASVTLRQLMNAAPRVEKPFLPGKCWALVRAYTGSRFAQFVNCQKPARKGCLTCRWHQDLEAMAQEAARQREAKEEN